MPNELDDILHDLDHQKLEAIGVEKLANDTKPLLSGILVIIRMFDTASAQDLAAIETLHEVLQERACSRCLDLSKRIKRELIRDYTEFNQENRK